MELVIWYGGYPKEVGKILLQEWDRAVLDWRDTKRINSPLQLRLLYQTLDWNGFRTPQSVAAGE